MFLAVVAILVLYILLQTSVHGRLQCKVARTVVVQCSRTCTLGVQSDNCWAPYHLSCITGNLCLTSTLHACIKHLYTACIKHQACSIKSSCVLTFQLPGAFSHLNSAKAETKKKLEQLRRCSHIIFTHNQVHAETGTAYAQQDLCWTYVGGFGNLSKHSHQGWGVCLVHQGTLALAFGLYQHGTSLHETPITPHCMMEKAAHRYNI